jgi:tRNA nucleotidyltransferase (CCA-adding enzyme)
MSIKIEVPEIVSFIASVLSANDYDAYVVGGAVRDSILGKEPKDWDMSTNATPDEVLALFDADGTITKSVGKAFGIVIISVPDLSDMSVEVATYRVDGEYVDGRRPESVKFEDVTLLEDLSRRDSTMNAMAYDPIHEYLVDPFGGEFDVKAVGLVVPVGLAVDRIIEDPVRMLRYIRQATQHNLRLSESVRCAITSKSHRLTSVAKERIKIELDHILMSPTPSVGLKLLEETGLLEFVIPQLVPTIGFNQNSSHHTLDVFGHICAVVDHIPSKLHLRWAALLHDIGKPETYSVGEDGAGHFYGHHKASARIAREVLGSLNASTELTDTVANLCYEHMYRSPKMRKGGIRRLVGRLTDSTDKDIRVQVVTDLQDLIVADIVGHSPSNYVKVLKDTFAVFDDILEGIEEHAPFTRKDLKIDGNDLIHLGIKKGPRLGVVLDALLEKVLDNPELNLYHKLMESAEDLNLELEVV